MPLMPLELQINLLPVSGKKIPKFAKIYQFLCYSQASANMISYNMISHNMMFQFRSKKFL